MTQELSSKIVEIAHARRRFGYRRIHDMLRPHFPGVNHKRVYRLYSAATQGRIAWHRRQVHATCDAADGTSGVDTGNVKRPGFEQPTMCHIHAALFEEQRLPYRFLCVVQLLLGVPAPEIEHQKQSPDTVKRCWTSDSCLAVRVRDNSWARFYEPVKQPQSLRNLNNYFKVATMNAAGPQCPFITAFQTGASLRSRSLALRMRYALAHHLRSFVGRKNADPL